MVLRGAEVVVYEFFADWKVDVCNITLMCTILVAEYSQYLEFYFIHVKYNSLSCHLLCISLLHFLCGMIYNKIKKKKNSTVLHVENSKE